MEEEAGAGPLRARLVLVDQPHWTEEASAGDRHAFEHALSSAELWRPPPVHHHRDDADSSPGGR